MSNTQPRTALRRSRENDNNITTTAAAAAQTPFTCIVVLRHILSFAAVNAHVFLFTLPQINMSCRETVDSFLDHEWQRLFGGIVDPVVLTLESQQRAKLEACSAIARIIAGCADLSNCSVISKLLQMRARTKRNKKRKHRIETEQELITELFMPQCGNLAWSVLLASKSDEVFDHLYDVAMQHDDTVTNLAESDKEWRCKEIRRIIINLRGFLDPCPNRELAMHRVPRLLEIADHWLPDRTSETEARAWLDVLISLLHFAFSGDLRRLERRTLQLLDFAVRCSGMLNQIRVTEAEARAWLDPLLWLFTRAVRDDCNTLIHRTLRLIDFVVRCTGCDKVFGAAATSTRAAVNGILANATINKLFADMSTVMHHILRPMRATADRRHSVPQQAATAQPGADCFESEAFDDDGIVKYAISVIERMPMRPVDNNVLQLLDDLVTILLFYPRPGNAATTHFCEQAVKLFSKFMHFRCSHPVVSWACHNNVRLWIAVCEVLDEEFYDSVPEMVSEAVGLVQVLLWHGTPAEIHAILKSTTLLDHIIGLACVSQPDVSDLYASGMCYVDRLMTISTPGFNFKKMVEDSDPDFVEQLKLFCESSWEEFREPAIDLARSHYPELVPSDCDDDDY